MFHGNGINKNVLPLALTATALAAALASTSGFAGVEQRLIETEPPRSHASEAVVERIGPRGEVLLQQDDGDSEQVSELRKGRIGLLPEVD
jgi:hypothetical protein